MFCPIIATIIKFFRTLCNPKEGISVKNFWIIGLLVFVVASWNFFARKKRMTIKKLPFVTILLLAELEVATKILENMELVGDRYVFTLTRDEPCGKHLPFENLEECRE